MSLVVGNRSSKIERMNTSAAGVTAADRLRSAVAARVEAEIAEAVAIADFAAENEWPADAQIDLVGQRPARVGADGTPVLNEFIALEIAALKGISVGSATWLIRDIVNLRYRHPRLWARMRAGDLPVYRACQLATNVARFTLTREQLRQLDTELAAQAGQLPWRRLLTLCDGLLADLVPDQLLERARQAREQRYVRKLETDDPSVAYLSGRVDTADAIYFDGMLDRIADILAGQGDTDSKDVRRAKSLGILATPARATLLLAEAASGSQKHDAPQPVPDASPTSVASRPRTGHLFDGAGRRHQPSEPRHSQLFATDSAPDEGAAHRANRLPLDPIDQVWLAAEAAIPKIRWTNPKLLPKSTVYVHVAEHTLMTGSGPVRAENVGPLAAAMLGLLVGHTRIRLTPVVRPFENIAVDAYEIPRRIRDQVLLRDQVEVFPFSSRSARNQQLDHTRPYRKGVAGQTRADNLGPLSTKAHRGKTHGHWRLDQPRPGLFWWKSPAGFSYRVGPRGTTRLDDEGLLGRAFRRALWKHDHRLDEGGDSLQC